MNTFRTLSPLVIFTAIAGCASAPPKHVAGVACQSPPPLHCADSGCTPELVASQGNAVDAKTGRKFFLDYPCDLKPNEKVTFVLNLHGGGSIGNWQRHYFPIMDLKEKYRLVVASPSGVIRAWTPENDDQHLRNIVDYVYEQFGAQNIKAFWLAGHSQGGQTSNRLINAGSYRDRLTGWVSLSGGRLGSKREDIRATIPRNPGADAPAVPGQPPAGAGAPRLAADASILPDFAFSHIYTAGEHEYTPAGPPKESKWAQKLQCGPQTRKADIVDTKAGYVSDSRPQQNPNKIWGLKPRPGTAQMFVYPNCSDGKVVADVVRIDKGHTEGLEPKVTEEIVKLMMQAK